MGSAEFSDTTAQGFVAKHSPKAAALEVARVIRLRNLVSNYLSCPYGLMKSALEVRPGVVYLLTEVS